MSHDPHANFNGALPLQTPPPTRSPWTLRLGGIAWLIAGLLFALAPALAVFFTNLQTDSLIKKINALTTNATAAIPEVGRLQGILDEIARYSDSIWDSIAWILTPLIIGYVCVGLLSLSLYIALSLFTMRGAQWARILATVLCAISTPVAVIIWLTLASLFWLPLNALWANHIGLALIALQIVGLVLVWLPRSNTFVRNRRNVAPSA